jgi:hypothetical protein
MDATSKQRPAVEFPWDKYLTMGAYGIWDLCEEEEGLPPIEYREGEAL